MGDRANVVMGNPANDEPKVYLYSHWGGHELPEILQAALRRKQRWNDAPYLARMIFCAMVEGHEKNETGYGISASLRDNEHPLLVVDCDGGMVHLVEQRGTGEPKWREPLCGYSFSAFCDLSLDDRPNPWDVLLNLPKEDDGE